MCVFSCQGEKSHSGKNKIKEKDSNLIEKKNENDSINFDLDSLDNISLKKKIPYGNRKLIEFEFPKKKRFFYGGLYQPDYIPTTQEKSDSIKYARRYDTLSNINILNFSEKISKEYFNKFLKIAKSINEIEEGFQVNYDPNIISTSIIKLPKISGFNVFGIFFSLQEGRYFKQLSPLFIVLNNKGDFVSAISSNKGSDDVSVFSRFVYIDKDYVFHFKNFISDEAVNISYQKYEKYSISPTGHFIRYYNIIEGLHENYDEKGSIKNNTKDGKWIEFKYTDGNGNYRVFIESQYKEGIANGIWRFYNYPYLDELDHTINKERKEQLIYTETYENGQMIKREFVK